MSTTSDTGAIGEHLMVVDLLRAGHRVYKEVTNGHEVDFLVETPHGIKKVQTKSWANTSKGVISVDLERRFKGKDGTWQRVSYDADSIDIIALVAIDRGQILYIPFRDFEGRITMQLRFEPPKNGQTKGVRVASDYTFERAISA